MHIQISIYKNWIEINSLGVFYRLNLIVFNHIKKSGVKIIMNIKIEFFKDDLIQAIGAGIYQISICKNNKSAILYIGESVFMLVRCANHLFNFNKDPNYFGFTNEEIEDSNIVLKFTLLEQISDSLERKKREKHLINEYKPLSQSGISDRQKNIEDKISSFKDFFNS